LPAINPAIAAEEYPVTLPEINPAIAAEEYLQPLAQKPPGEAFLSASQPASEEPGQTRADLQGEGLAGSPPPLIGEDSKAEIQLEGNNPAHQIELRPPYWTLRAAGYGVLWAAAFLLPYTLQQMTDGPLYLASAGFALFLAAALAPFGTATVHQAANKQHARSLFGHFELSFWLRIAAIVVLICVYFASTVGKVNDWNQTTKVVSALLSLF
jgi:hypothetical protein